MTGSDGRPRRRGGPWVNLATLCHEIGKDDAGPFIRGLMDRVDIKIAAEEPTAGSTIEVKTGLLLALRLAAGDARGTYRVRVDIEGEDGRGGPGSENTITFDGRSAGAGLDLNLDIAFWRSGAYFLNVFANDRLLTRIPFQVRLHFTGSQGAS